VRQKLTIVLTMNVWVDNASTHRLVIHVTVI